MTSGNAALLTWCEQQQPWLRQTIELLARRESPSTDKSAVDACGRDLQMLLREAGGRVDVIAQADRGDHVRAEFGEGSPQLLLLGHFDTVWPTGQLERMPVREDGGRLYGPGVFDMKGGIAVAILAIRALRAAGELPFRVVVLLTSDEEIGSASSREWIEREARRSRAVLVLEPSLPGGAVKTSRKGCGEFELTVRGVAAHAGIDPGKGASAIHELAHQIAAIEQLQDRDRGISVNVGMIEGGSRPNVIAERARAVIDVRVPTIADGVRVETAIKSLRPRLHQTSLQVEGGISRPPLERTPLVLGLYEEARVVAQSLGRELGEGGTGGGSDGNFTAALGVPTLDGLGCRGDGAHALHEHVEIADLPWRGAFLAALLRRLGGVK